MTADEIIPQMKAGNERFRSGKPQHRDLLREAKATAKNSILPRLSSAVLTREHPPSGFSTLVSAISSAGRVAGNVADEDILGTMEFAYKVAGSEVVLVMDRTACGVIKGAIEEVRLGNLTALLAKIRPAEKPLSTRGSVRPRNYAFADAVARKNVSPVGLVSGKSSAAGTGQT